MRLGAKLLLSALSLVASLGAAEVAATVAARGAYPYLNLFLPDADLGVRLEPNGETRIRSRHGRITTIETDADGRRIHPIHPTGERPLRILLLGDSQVFGYHVEAGDALASRLSRLAGAEVIDAAVPSYGPHEYVLQAKRLVPELRPTHVLFVVNLANDWWESNVDNTRRSTARDGWLVSRSGGDGAPLLFPGRRFLLGRSHLVLAFRRLAAHASAAPAARTPARLLRDLETLRSKPKRFTPFLAAADRVATEHGAKLLAAALPLDVMAHETEWAKYRAQPADVASLETLLGDFEAEVADLGIESVSLLEPLRRASPGAFLNDDPHLSPKGHTVFAEAVARHLKPTSALASDR